MKKISTSLSGSSGFMSYKWKSSCKIFQNTKNAAWLMRALKKTGEKYPLLNKEEEKNLIKNNLENPKRLRKLLFMHNVQVVFNLSKKYVCLTESLDDLIQNGMFGLYVATTKFDPSMDIKFITYATFWIKKYMLMEFYDREMKVRNASISLATPGKYKSSEFINFFSDYLDPTIKPNNQQIDSQILINENKSIFLDLISCVSKSKDLTDQDKEIFLNLYLNQERPTTISRLYGLSIYSILKAKEKTLKYCKHILKEKYGIKKLKDVEMV